MADDCTHRAAGDFSPWLEQMQEALRGEHGSDVPCDGCTACCTASQFIHIAPTETETLAVIPEALLFPAPRMPRGHVLLGYDESGRCPMLIDNRCSIYEHRPRTCRTYDCRVLAAADVELDEPEKQLIAERVREWRFAHPTASDRHEHDAVRAAAVFLRRHPEAAPDGAGTASPTQLAVLAVEAHEAFLHRDDAASTAATNVEPDVATVRDVLRRQR